MKKILLLILFTIVSINLIGCNSNSEQNDDDKKKIDEIEEKIVEVEKVSLSKYDVSLTSGEKIYFSYNVYPNDATDKTVKVTSSNSNIADYINGNIVGLNEGNCVIKVVANNGVEASCIVEVKKKLIAPSAISFKYNGYKLVENQEVQLSLNIKPDYCENLKGNISYINNSIAQAKYDYDLSTQRIIITVKGIKAGTTDLKVTTEGGASCSCKIVVIEDQTKYVTINAPTLPKTVGYYLDTTSGKVYKWYTMVKITEVKIDKEQAGDTSVRVNLTIKFEKTYDYDGDLGTNSCYFNLLIYKENKVFSSSQKVIGGYNINKGTKATITTSFYVTTATTKYRTLSFDFGSYCL